MNHQTVKPNGSYIQHRQEVLYGSADLQVPLPALQLYQDPEKLNLYQHFKHEYSGEPSGVIAPAIARVRDGKNISYNERILSAVTADGTHFIHMRRSQHPAPEVAHEHHYFAVTVDVATGKASEWIVDAIHLSEPHEQDSITYRMRHDSNQLGEARTMSLTYTNAKATMVFNDADEVPHTFQSTAEIDHDLWILNNAAHLAHVAVLSQRAA